MAIEPERSLYEDAELVFGIFRYDVNIVRLSELAMSLLERPSTGIVAHDEATRLSQLMDAGNEARAIGQGGDILALAAAARIHSTRERRSDGPVPFVRKAHVLRSLKHPDEVRALRRLYGSGFFLLGVVTASEERRRFLMARKGCSEPDVVRLFKRDEAEDGVSGNWGQRTGDTFHLSDVFVGIDDKVALARFLDLVFGNPFETPSRDEYAMFLAFSAAVRSGDLSRQVGAVIVSSDGDVVAVGTNDVPTAGGGLCWPGAGDDRDLRKGYDTNEQQRTSIVEEILETLKPDDIAMDDWKATGWRKLEEAKVMDITEYGRAVHAEMEALLSCSRSGVSPRDATLFSTTFPCHNCAKHALAAGIARVVYVEPYPKSQAAMMYQSSIRLGGPPMPGSVLFEPFVGLGPRRFFDLFSMTLSSGYALKRKQSGRIRAWEPATAIVRAPMVGSSYLAREAKTAETVLDLFPRRPKSSPRRNPQANGAAHEEARGSRYPGADR